MANGAGGRKPKYDDIKDKLYLVEAWARDGLNNEQIALNLGIHVDTLYNWKNVHFEFSEALKKNKLIADRAVENSLYKAANGYDVEEVTRELKQKVDADGKVVYKVNKKGDKIPVMEMVEVKRVTKHIEPNPTSMIFWLKNRQPGEWRDRKEIGVTVDKKLENFFSEGEGKDE